MKQGMHTRECTQEKWFTYLLSGNFYGFVTKTRRYTWSNLIELLYDSEQRDLAEQAKDALGL